MKYLYWIKRGSKFVFDLIDLNRSFLTGEYILNQLIYQTDRRKHIYIRHGLSKECAIHTL